MAWLGKVSLGGFPDLAGAVTKLSESVKNIEKNFDSALGLDEKSEPSGEASGLWPSASDRKALFDPVRAFMGHRGDTDADEPSEKEEPVNPPIGETATLSESAPSPSKNTVPADESEIPIRRYEEFYSREAEMTADVSTETSEKKIEVKTEIQSENAPSVVESLEARDSEHLNQQKEEPMLESTADAKSDESTVEQIECSIVPFPDELHHGNDTGEKQENQETQDIKFKGEVFSDYDHASDANGQGLSELNSNFVTSNSKDITDVEEHASQDLSGQGLPDLLKITEIPVVASEHMNHVVHTITKAEEIVSQANHPESESGELPLTSGIHSSSSSDPVIELEKLRKEMKMMEAALQGAARQAQAKADEIAKMMNENEILKSTVDDLKKKSSETETDALREEYHQRVSALERKVYALTRERDTLRREQNKKSDVASLLKEKDEIISQVMAEGENLSKKQATQEATIRKLRAQIRELEEEKQRLNSKLQVEETKVESIKKDKAATEKLLQETIERNQAELAAQKEFYTNALNAAKEAEAEAEARANNEAKSELESRLREAAERESMLVQTLEELRQTLSRTERQSVFREDMLQRDIDDLQKRYQASELRYNELITQVPESTRPLLRQIEAMQETAARKAEAWAGVEKNLNARLEAAEAKSVASEEKERLMNDRLSQTLSRMTILETQIACLRTEQTQLGRTLEKERQRASESRQEYLALMEEAATHEGHSKQLEEEIRELQAKHKQELQEVSVHKELLAKDLERERSARLELEKKSHVESSMADKGVMARHPRSSENGNMPTRNLSSSGSISSIEESFFLQASLDSSEGSILERRISGETTISPYFLKSMTPSSFEAALRQRDGELASYISRLESLESIRDSLAEELVKMTEQCEKLRAEASLLPKIRAELEALRRRHSSALELMGERDEELEELRADIIDLKEMYREQVDLLVNKIQMMSSSIGAT